MVEGVRRVAVIGAGTMGAGIAQVSAMAGWWTVLSDVRAEALTPARELIAAQLTGAMNHP